MAELGEDEVVSGAARDRLADALVDALGIGSDDQEKRAAYNAESLNFYGAPHVALLFAPDTAESRLAADVGMHGQTLLLAMTAHGVASCRRRRASTAERGRFEEPVRHQVSDLEKCSSDWTRTSNRPINSRVLCH